MKDFNQFVNDNQNKGNTPSGLLELVTSLSKKYDGKSQTELLSAIYQEAKKNKQNGTLTNEQIDQFAYMISPILDDKKKKYLVKIVDELKKI